MTAWSLIAFLSQLSTLKLTNLGWTCIYSDRSSYLQDSEYNIHLPFHCGEVEQVPFLFLAQFCELSNLLYDFRYVGLCSYIIDFNMMHNLVLPWQDLLEGGNLRRFISHKEVGRSLYSAAYNELRCSGLVKAGEISQAFQCPIFHRMKLMKCYILNLVFRLNIFPAHPLPLLSPLLFSHHKHWLNGKE